MDMRTGQTYATKQEALDAGVPESDLVEIIRPKNGPFKGRTYKRVNGQLVRVRLKGE